jgi:hypothetical protein
LPGGKIKSRSGIEKGYIDQPKCRDLASGCSFPKLSYKRGIGFSKPLKILAVGAPLRKLRRIIGGSHGRVDRSTDILIQDWEKTWGFKMKLLRDRRVVAAVCCIEKHIGPAEKFPVSSDQLVKVVGL